MVGIKKRLLTAHVLDNNTSVNEPRYDIKKNVQAGTTQKQNIYGIRIRITEEEADCKEQSVNPAEYDRVRKDLSVVKHMLVAYLAGPAYFLPAEAVEFAYEFLVCVLLSAVEIRSVLIAYADAGRGEILDDILSVEHCAEPVVIIVDFDIQ